MLMSSKIIFQEELNLVIIWIFFHFVFLKKNLWTLYVLHIKEI